MILTCVEQPRAELNQPLDGSESYVEPLYPYTYYFCNKYTFGRK